MISRAAAALFGLAAVSGGLAVAGLMGGRPLVGAADDQARPRLAAAETPVAVETTAHSHAAATVPAPAQPQTSPVEVTGPPASSAEAAPTPAAPTAPAEEPARRVRVIAIDRPPAPAASAPSNDAIAQAEIPVGDAGAVVDILPPPRPTELAAALPPVAPVPVAPVPAATGRPAAERAAANAGPTEVRIAAVPDAPDAAGVLGAAVAEAERSVVATLPPQRPVEAVAAGGPAVDPAPASADTVVPPVAKSRPTPNPVGRIIQRDTVQPGPARARAVREVAEPTRTPRRVETVERPSRSERLADIERRRPEPPRFRPVEPRGGYEPVTRAEIVVLPDGRRYVLQARPRFDERRRRVYEDDAWLPRNYVGPRERYRREAVIGWMNGE